MPQPRQSRTVTATDDEIRRTRIANLIEGVTAEDFAAWYQNRQHAANIREGTPYFNGPSPPPPAERHRPSSLLQCHRKLHYREQNAPAETPKPTGHFWIGQQFEENVVLPYLERHVVEEDEYVRNSMWVDSTVETTAGTLQLKGTTDPVIVDYDSRPILPTEVKTKSSLDKLDGPNQHHKAQLYSYLFGLSQQYDYNLFDGLLIYGSRTTLNIKPFHIVFDPDWFRTVLVDWAAAHTEYRLSDTLPPADPEYDWECGVCAYRHRCGQTDRASADTHPRGLLPRMVYPKARVREYLAAHPGAKLTPTLAATYPDLVDIADVYDWQCPACSTTWAWGAVEWTGDPSMPPSCPSCSTERGIPAWLTGPTPDEQQVAERVPDD